MGISVKISYEFELNGQTYSKIGAEWGETEKEEDIKDLNNNAEEKRTSAICDAFGLDIDEFEEKKEEFKNVIMKWAEIYA